MDLEQNIPEAKTEILAEPAPASAPVEPVPAIVAEPAPVVLAEPVADPPVKKVSPPAVTMKTPIAALMCIAIALHEAFYNSYDCTHYLLDLFTEGFENPYFLHYLATAYLLPIAILLIAVGLLLYKKCVPAFCGLGTLLLVGVKFCHYLGCLFELAENGGYHQTVGWLILDLLSFLPLILVAIGCFLLKKKAGRILRTIGGIFLILIVIASAVYVAVDDFTLFLEEMNRYRFDAEATIKALQDAMYTFNVNLFLSYPLWTYLALLFYSPKAKK